MTDPTAERAADMPVDELTHLTVLLTPTAHRALGELAQLSGHTGTDVVNEALLFFRGIWEDLAAGNLYSVRDDEMTRIRLAPDEPATPARPVVWVRQPTGDPVKAEVRVDRGAPTVQVEYAGSHVTQWVDRSRLTVDRPDGDYMRPPVVVVHQLRDDTCWHDVVYRPANPEVEGELFDQIPRAYDLDATMVTRDGVLVLGAVGTCPPPAAPVDEADVEQPDEVDPTGQGDDDEDPLAGVGADYRKDPAERIAAVAAVAPEYVHQVEEPAEFAPNDRFTWTAGNGTVRTGTILEWFAPTGTWFVEIDRDPSLPVPDGYRTWFKAADLRRVPAEEPVISDRAADAILGLVEADMRLRGDVPSAEPAVEPVSLEQARAALAEPVKVRCPVCGWLAGVTADGLFDEHLRSPGGITCSGSGTPVKETAEKLPHAPQETSMPADDGWVDLPPERAMRALANWHNGGAEELDAMYTEALTRQPEAGEAEAGEAR